ncbi:S-adenosyl-L-methionine-dependent methyltransferase [Immersiella caudata]|uniref:S-adenosyl-L-methionine-dependent methyltransferase n=1 Tax=Immersiella caudata TaxID=314043 RepID=A0AA39WCA4_9PEZI|nr:S-adenosyl-L-methionine-dependent methyltransferase [Immersiella caudata]
MSSSNSPSYAQSQGDADSDKFEFTFEFYLDSRRRIESDSIFEYHKEYGRTYHAYRAGSYHVPNDVIEHERQENQYELVKILLDGRLYLAPLSKDPAKAPRKILDLATGTGRWAIEMADAFPHAQVIGTDLSPVQPELVPPNLRFEIDDGNDEWQEGPDWHDIDYIHFRFTVVSWADWGRMLRVAFERLRPGGYVEMQEPDCDVFSDNAEIPASNPLKAWFCDLRAAAAMAGRPIDAVPNLKQLFIEAGFVDVQEKVYKIPVGDWPRGRRLKKMGRLWRQNIADGLPGFSYALWDKWLYRTREQIEVQLVEVRQALMEKKSRAYERFYVVYGRKPEVY